MFHGALIPLLFPICAYGLNFRKPWKIAVWIFTGLVIALGIAEGFATQLVPERMAGILRMKSGDGTPGWARGVSMLLAFGTILPVILAGIAAYRPVGSRMHLIRKSEDRLIIDDCYNANPQSMAAALNILSQTPCRHRLAVLGDMGELGELSPSAHLRVGELTQELGIDTVIAIGDKAKRITEKRTLEIYWYPTIEAAQEMLCRQFTPGTTALVKASHAMEFEKVVAFLERQ